MKSLPVFVEYQRRANIAARAGQHRAAMLWQARADAASVPLSQPQPADSTAQNVRVKRKEKTK